MSRIGKQPIAIPVGVRIELQGSTITVLGCQGRLERNLRPEIEVNLKNNFLICAPKGTSKRELAFWGMTRSLISNMIIGVDQGFSKKLMVEGVGYRVNLSEQILSLHVGYSSAVDFKLPDGISATVDKDNSIIIQGINKELVGLTAAKIRSVRPPEPYKGKGIRYANEHILRKVGKSGGKK
jgi:large subunit ribosomal protein L6